MVIAPHTASAGKMTAWSGWIMSSFVGAFLLIDCGLKLLELVPAVQATTQLGYAADLVFNLGLVQLVCLAAYAVPRTSLLGAILLTGYLGGTVATHVRAGSGLFSLIFPLMIGVLIWGGLLLRDRQLRAHVLPLR